MRKRFALSVSNGAAVMSDDTVTLTLRKRGTGPNGGRPARYPDSTVTRALELMWDTRSIAGAHRLLEAELAAKDELVPALPTLLDWAREHQEVTQHIQADRKRDMVALSTEAASAWAGRMVAAATNKKEDGSYAVTDGQVGVNYGISMDKRIAWENAGNKAPPVAVQFNLVTKD